MIIGEIGPAKEDKQAPVFRIVSRHAHRLDALPCEHRRYALDEKWATVTCEDCGERLDAFSVLLNNAHWIERFKTERARWQNAERSLRIVQLRTIRKRKGLSPSRVAEIDDCLSKRYTVTLERLAEVSRSAESELHVARMQRRAKRASAQPDRLVGT